LLPGLRYSAEDALLLSKLIGAPLGVASLIEFVTTRLSQSFVGVGVRRAMGYRYANTVFPVCYASAVANYIFEMNTAVR